MRPPLVDEDFTGSQPVFLVTPDENVYSYFMFIGPTERKRRQVRSPGRQHEINWDVVMGYVLVALNFFMQGVLLWLIFQSIVLDNISWQNGIVKLNENGGALPVFSEEANECNDGGSLCFREKGEYSCAPPSVQLTGRWSELDTNGDGVWTREEVVAKRAELKCKYVIDPVEVFDVLLAMLKEREKLLWLHPEVKNGSRIHLPYFTYIMADVLMCSYRDVDMCSNLLQRGFFDVPLEHGTAPRVGTTIESALRYCHKLLAPGGMCERNLPSTYAVWKTSSQAECGAPEYHTFKYKHPATKSEKSLLAVDYSSRTEYEGAQDSWFMLFKGIVLFLWMLLNAVEVRDVIKFLTLCARIPDASEFGDDAVIMEQDPADPEDVRFRIQGIEPHHRWSMVAVNVVRLFLEIALSIAGIGYLIKTNDYANLLMNGVSLAFIAEISSVLWSQALRDEVQDQTGDIKPIKVRMFGWDWVNRRPAIIDMLVILVVLVLVYLIMAWQKSNIVVPVHDALQCTCLSQGELCKEAQIYNYDFWHEYWLHGIPGVFEAVASLKLTVAEGAPGGVPPRAPAAAGTSLLDVGAATDAALDARAASLRRRLKALADRFQAFLLSEPPSGGATKGPGAHLAAEMRESLLEVEAEVSRGARQPHGHVSLKA